MRLFLAALLLTLLCVTSAPAQRSTQALTLLNSAARTATATSSDQVNTQFGGYVHVIINFSAYTSGNWTPKIQEQETPNPAPTTTCAWARRSRPPA